jgi:hypothetical protein
MNPKVIIYPVCVVVLFLYNVSFSMDLPKLISLSNSARQGEKIKLLLILPPRKSGYESWKLYYNNKDYENGEIVESDTMSILEKTIKIEDEGINNIVLLCFMKKLSNPLVSDVSVRVERGVINSAIIQWGGVICGSLLTILIFFLQFFFKQYYDIYTKIKSFRGIIKIFILNTIDKIDNGSDLDTPTWLNNPHESEWFDIMHKCNFIELIDKLRNVIDKNRKKRIEDSDAVNKLKEIYENCKF